MRKRRDKSVENPSVKGIRQPKKEILDLVNNQFI